MIIGVVAGLRHGPAGVALGYSSAMVLLATPIIAWAKYGTGLTTRDYLSSIKQPMMAGVFAGAAGCLFRILCQNMLSGVPFLILGLSISLAVYAGILLMTMGQKTLYVDLMKRAYQQSR